MGKDNSWIWVVVAIGILVFIGSQFSILPSNTVFTSATWTDANTLTLSNPQLIAGKWNEPLLSSPREATEVMKTDYGCSTALRSGSSLNFWSALFKSWGTTGTENILNWLVINKQCGFHLNKDTIGETNYNILKQHGTVTDYTQYVSADKAWNQKCICQLCGLPYPCSNMPCYADWNCFQWVYTGEYHTFIFSPSSQEITSYINSKVECYLDFGSKYYGVPEIFDNDQIVCRIVLPSGGVSIPTTTTAVFRFGVTNPTRTNSQPIRGDLGYCGDNICQSVETSANCPHDCVTASCGDNVCSAGEATSCPTDCGVTPPIIPPIIPTPTPILGCTDSTAMNYLPSATQDDGSCIPSLNPVHNPCTCDPTLFTGGCCDSPIQPITPPTDDLARSWWLFALIGLIAVGVFVWRR